MARIGLAFRVFFRTLSDAVFAERLERLALADPTTPEAPTPAPATVKPLPTKAPARNDALSLLAVLQREARFVDFIKETLSDYTDAQIGAAARDVHRDCGSALERLFELRPLLEQAEGSPVDIPVGAYAGRFHLTGNVAGQPPYRGTLAHHGWQATRCELPQWTGSQDAALIVAPAEVELK